MKRGANKILVIDDDQTVVGTITAVLRAAAFFQKPVNPEALKEVVADLLSSE